MCEMYEDAELREDLVDLMDGFRSQTGESIPRARIKLSPEGERYVVINCGLIPGKASKLMESILASADLKGFLRKWRKYRMTAERSTRLTGHGQERVDCVRINFVSDQWAVVRRM